VLGPTFRSSLGPQGKGFGFRGSFSADFAIFEILGGAGDINNSISMRNYYHTRMKSFRHLGLATHNYFSAWTKVWPCICPSAPSITAPGGRSGQILDVLGRLATYSSHHVRTISRIKLYRHLLMFLNKDSSAWAAVWACSCCSRLSITPSKADLDRFWDSQSTAFYGS